MNCILVPTHALDISLLERLANSIDYPVKNKVVINNGKVDALDEWLERHPDWDVIHYGRNLGVAGSWNLAPEIFPTEDAWLIINDDHELQPGVLEKICKASDEHHKNYPVIYINQYEAYDMFVWTRKGFEQFGSFDENFYPVYYEDWEYRLRMNLSGAKGYQIGDTETMPIKHGKPYTGGKRYRKLLDTTDLLQRDYYTRKWGVVGDKPADETFEHPFNTIKNDVKFWELEVARREEIEKMWNEFISVDEPLRSDICE